MKNIYLLKDLAVSTGYSTYTVKYYLGIGLLEEIGRSPITNFRYFDDGSVDRLKEIRGMRSKGLSLKEIKKRLKI
ncbi:MAG: MerR family transcriptional regulator [Candidatus Aceula lacicola]|nr:MerR family transcriptional regulator [Candidatus Aceula lacicola]